MIASPLLLLLASPQAVPMVSIENIFWKGCVEGKVALPVGSSSLKVTDLPKSVRRRYDQAADINAYAIAGTVDRYLIMTSGYSDNDDGLVGTCAIFSREWSGLEARNAITRRLLKWDEDKPDSEHKGEWLGGQFLAYQFGYIIDFDDVRIGKGKKAGLAEVQRLTPEFSAIELAKIQSRDFDALMKREAKKMLENRER